MRFLAYLFFALLSIVGLAIASRTSTTTNNVYGDSFKSIDGQPLSLAQYKGKVLLIVNTASRCGFTSQYAGLEKLYEAYREKGFVLLGVPSNDFGQQEPGNREEIKKFCQTNFNVTFPMTDKVEVSGDGAHPFYRQVRAELGFFAAPRWNFYKYLVDRQGHLVAWFPSTTAPSASKLTQAIETELNKHPPL